MENSPAGVREFVKGAGDKITGVLEATRNWGLMYDWLEEEIEDVKLAHPLKVKAIAEARVKTDKIDSNILAHLLRCDLLPESHIPSREARYVKQVLRQRLFYVKIRTKLKNRIREILDKHPEIGKHPFAKIFGMGGIEWLENIEISKEDGTIMKSDLKLLKSVQERINKSDNLIEKLGKKDDRVNNLMSIPGIGKFLAVLVCHEIDDIERFKNPKKLHAYAGLVPSTYASGNRIIHGRITKQGNKWLRWGMVEAVWPAVRKDKWLNSYFERIKEKRGGNKARVATAKKLLTLAYYVLKEKRFYKVFGRSENYLAASC
jgi:transposase